MLLEEEEDVLLVLDVVVLNAVILSIRFFFSRFNTSFSLFKSSICLACFLIVSSYFLENSRIPLSALVLDCNCCCNLDIVSSLVALNVSNSDLSL